MKFTNSDLPYNNPLHGTLRAHERERYKATHTVAHVPLMLRIKPCFLSAAGPRGTSCLPLLASDHKSNSRFHMSSGTQGKRQSENARFAPNSLASHLADQCVQRKRQFEYARFAPSSLASQLARVAVSSVAVPSQKFSHVLSRRAGVGQFVGSGIRCRSNINLLGVPAMSKGASQLKCPRFVAGICCLITSSCTGRAKAVIVFLQPASRARR